jgi:hypothetical protein
VIQPPKTRAGDFRLGKRSADHARGQFVRGKAALKLAESLKQLGKESLAGATSGSLTHGARLRPRGGGTCG